MQSKTLMVRRRDAPSRTMRPASCYRSSLATADGLFDIRIEEFRAVAGRSPILSMRLTTDMRI